MQRTDVVVGQWERDSGGVSWASILAGAVAAAALSLILLALGSGLGLSAVSPWSYAGMSGTGLGISAIAWLMFMAATSSGLGGYLAGRLRPKWQVPSDETFFRDTAHGFLSWAVATVLSAGLLAGAATAMLGTAAKATGAVAGTAVTAAAAAAGSATAGQGSAGSRAEDSANYFVDMLFRGSRVADPGTDPRAIRGEAMTIIARSFPDAELSPADRSYVAQLVSQRTGISQSEAEQRVVQVAAAAKAAAEATTARAKGVAEEARRATLHVALWIFISLLLGAFCAALAASIGGRQRDEWSRADV